MSSDNSEHSLPVKDPAGRRVFRRVPIPKCADCGGVMIRLESDKGPFMGCLRFPECRATQRAHLGVACPRPLCTGVVAEKRRRSSDGHAPMVGCSNYPTCKFAVFESPEHVPCFRCKLPFVIVDENGARRCIDPDCGPGAAMHELDPNEVIDDLLRYMFRTYESRDEIVRTLFIAGGVACEALGVSPEQASEAFAVGYKTALTSRANTSKESP